MATALSAAVRRVMSAHAAAPIRAHIGRSLVTCGSHSHVHLSCFHVPNTQRRQPPHVVRWHGTATAQTGSEPDPSTPSKSTKRLRRQQGRPLLDLKDFLSDVSTGSSSGDKTRVLEEHTDAAPYLATDALAGRDRAVWIETYGCQMNVSDTEVAWAVLEGAGFTRAESVDDADVALMVTCAIREGAEQRVFARLAQWHGQKKKRRSVGNSGHDAAAALAAAADNHDGGDADTSGGDRGLTIGVLGCMAERLKTRLLEGDHGVDLVCGPDAYRDLPRLLAHSHGTGNAAINVQLSFDETYADIAPVRLDPGSPSAFVTVMRGCDNMCTYCIVPFTRGRERSRDLESICREVEALSQQGVREVTLLGQNVNSYLDRSSLDTSSKSHQTPRAAGFSTVYKPKAGGRRFAELLRAVAEINPRMRIRFTSPHPKDFPDEVLEVIRDYDNVCSHIHLPAQSGSSSVLEAMRRGYTREAYFELVDHIRAFVPGVTLSSDFIAGFCGETDQDHRDTVDLIKRVRFDSAFLFAYSMREKTRAHHRLKDDVPEDVKIARLQELIDVFRVGAAAANAERVGTTQTVLVEGPSKRSDTELVGRTEGNIQLIFPAKPLLVATSAAGDTTTARTPRVGDFVEAMVVSSTSKTLRGDSLRIV